MISTSKLTVAFGAKPLFEDVSVKFFGGNCYGLIGANGAGKSTFLKVLSGDIDPSSGEVVIESGKRIAVLRQDQFAFDECQVLETVMMGHKELYEIYAKRNELYSKTDLTDDEGMLIGELEDKFGEMDGYSAESNAASMLSELGIDDSLHYLTMKELEAGQKIRVLLAQALFGNPDILLLDEPTNQLDYLSVLWLEQYLLDFENTVIVVSHDRHFLNKVCTHIADVDYNNIKISVGNYDFWQQSSQLLLKQQQEKNQKNEAKIKELEDFVRRFSANASKSKQATSRKKLIDKLRPEELAASSRRSPFIEFKPDRSCGNRLVKVDNVSYSVEGQPVLKDVSFELQKGERVAIAGNNSVSKTALAAILAGDVQPDSGTVEWGETISTSYFPKDNTAFFADPLTLTDWLVEYSGVSDTQLVRGYLGRMLFSGDDVLKTVNVLSGGEKARAMFARMMLAGANTLIFDEPTDHLDLEAITAVNDGLNRFQEAIFLVSHDFELVNTVCNRVIEVAPTGMINQKMDFDAYMKSDRVKGIREKLYS